jgi:hypothetical protein
MIQFGNDKIKEIYVGSDKVKEVYYGSEKVWDVRGYWVHKDTGVKTYFGLDDPSINNGIMSSPSWKLDCSEVKIPSGVTEIRAGCFLSSLSLRSITLPKSVTILGDRCFRNCQSLASITISEGVTNLVSSCFYGCKSLASITIPESVTNIGDFCFYNCTSLTLAVVLPATPPTLGTLAFTNAHSSLNIYVRSPYVNDYKTSWSGWASKISEIPDGYWVHKDTGAKMYFGLDADFITDGIMSSPSWKNDCSTVKIPYGVIGLGANCFSGGTSLTSIDIPESVTSIGNYCFNECSSLTSINIPEGVTNLGTGCFRGCSSLTSITLPEGVTNLGGSCFYECISLASITIPESVTSLGYSCFYGCTSLTLATVLPTTPPSLGEYAFDVVHSSFNIKVRSPYVNAYKTATNWTAYADKISAI